MSKVLLAALICISASAAHAAEWQAVPAEKIAVTRQDLVDAINSKQWDCTTEQTANGKVATIWLNINSIAYLVENADFVAIKAERTGSRISATTHAETTLNVSAVTIPDRKSIIRLYVTDTASHTEDKNVGTAAQPNYQPVVVVDSVINATCL